MRKFKECVATGILAVIFLLAIFALDDSYEDADLSAQVLDEAIVQAKNDAIKH